VTNILRLVATTTGYEVDYHWTTYRFLLSDGSTMDVRGVQDDSWLRTAVLLVANDLKSAPKDHNYGIIIVGVANLPEPTLPRVAVKKAAARKLAPK
jgi:hypothetical protein